MSTRFSLGIDLGTSNSAIALEDFESGRNQIVEITQILGLAQIGEKPTLPSALYIPHPDEFPQNGMQLPWSKKAAANRSLAILPAITARWFPIA